MTKIRNYELYVTTTGLTWEMVFNANFINYGWFGDDKVLSHIQLIIG